MTRRLEGRDGEIYRAWVLGTTQEALADRFEISNQRVSQIIAAVRANLPEEDIAERRARALEALDLMSVVAAEVVALEPSQAWSNGRPMTNEDGSPVLDYSTRLAGLDRFLKVADRQAKVLGLDAAVKAEVTVNERAREAAASAAAEAVARLNVDDE